MSHRPTVLPSRRATSGREKGTSSTVNRQTDDILRGHSKGELDYHLNIEVLPISGAIKGGNEPPMGVRRGNLTHYHMTHFCATRESK